MGEEVRVLIDKDGNVILKVSGQKGPQCLELTQSLEEGMGEVLERQRTPEFYQKANIRLRNTTSNPLKSA